MNYIVATDYTLIDSWITLAITDPIYLGLSYYIKIAIPTVKYNATKDVTNTTNNNTG